MSYKWVKDRSGSGQVEPEPEYHRPDFLSSGFGWIFADLIFQFRFRSWKNETDLTWKNQVDPKVLSGWLLLRQLVWKNLNSPLSTWNLTRTWTIRLTWLRISGFRLFSGSTWIFISGSGWYRVRPESQNKVQVNIRLWPNLNLIQADLICSDP